MTRIEKTQINCSAFIILTATLKKVQSDSVIEIVNDGQGIVVRPKKPEEKEEFYIDLTFLDQMFTKLVMTDHSPLLVTGEAEKYLRNCSFACYYFRKENERLENFDHFDTFHENHFLKTDNIENESILLKQFCQLFRIEYSHCLPFTNCDNVSNSSIQLPDKKTFNDVFKSIEINRQDKRQEIIFESYKLTMMESLDTLFAIKDLLFSKGIDTTAIPEYHWFSIGQDEEVHYNFITINGQRTEVSFKYDNVKFKIEKNCG